MKFFNIDMHISVIEDMKRIFTDLGHTVDDVSLSDHTWVFNKEKGSIPLLDNAKWMNLSCDQMSDLFYETYKDELSKYDAFIVTYPAPFSLLYKHFNKPIIVNIPIRYEWPLSFRPLEWEKFNKYLTEGVANGNILLVANNLFDKLYTEAFIDTDIPHISNICDYFGESYNPTNSTIVYSSQQKISELNSKGIKYKSDVLQNYKYGELMNLKGMVHIPYAGSYMSIFEQYSSNMPMFVPSQDFLYELYLQGLAFTDISFRRMYNATDSSPVKTLKGFDPNRYNDESTVKELISTSDFYDREWMPFIQEFSSFSHLKELIESTNFEEISNNMRKFNITKKENIYAKWEVLLKKVSKLIEKSL